jgi:hypothetical protein
MMTGKHGVAAWGAFRANATWLDSSDAQLELREEPYIRPPGGQTSRNAAVLRVTEVPIMKKQAVFGMALAAMILVAEAPVALAQDNRLQKIEDRLRALEQRIPAHSRSDSWDRNEMIAPAAIVLAIALFCGRWAQQNGRDFWLWFLGGLIFNIFTLLFLWSAIEEEKKANRKVKEQAAKESLEL